tara:strand:- start:3591 stop:5891 length:2301 start_codon:yes stop_codon:yes gene_type:complete
MKQADGVKRVHQDYLSFVSGLSPEESLVASMKLVEQNLELSGSISTTPDWLFVDFNENQWKIELNGAEVFLNFDVKFMSSTGKLEKLVSSEHKPLLNVFKCWLLIQSSPMHTGYQMQASKTISVKLRHTLYLIDYLLLNSEVIGLEKHFLLWDRDFIRVTLERLFEQDSITSAVYETEKRLDSFINENIKGHSDHELEVSFQNLVNEFSVSEEVIRSYSSELRRALGFLFFNNAIESRKKGGRYGLIKLNYIRNMLFSDTLYGHKVMQPKLEKYSVNDACTSSLSSEYPQHPLNKRLDLGISEKYFASIKQNLYMLAGVNSLAQHHGLETAKISNDIFEDIKLSALLETVKKSSGRVPTIGVGEVLPQIKNAFEFIFKFKDVLFEAVQTVLEGAAKEIPETSFKEFVDFGYKKYLTPEALAIGVQVIGYNGNDPERFKKRRENKDLFFLFNVLQGALQVVVGATMARRMGELVELDPFNAILPRGINPKKFPSTDFSLVFDNRKSGVAYGGEIVREQLSRPILRSVATLIYQWQEFNTRMHKNGFLKGTEDFGLFTSLSSRPVDFKLGNTESFIDNLDAFCDYFETRTYVDENGVLRRLYIRQHQLRRFFAMVFYWSYGYEASDTLRYFLAHTDIQHLERYVAEEMSGQVLRGVQAERIVDGIKNRDISKIGELEVILKNKFGISSVEYSTYEEIAADIDDGIILLNKTHEHVDPKRYLNYQALVSGLENLLDQGVISLKAEYVTVSSKGGQESNIIDLVLKYEQA